MNKYFLVIIAFLCGLPISGFAAKDIAGFDDSVPLSEKLLREYKTENPNVVYRQKDTPVNVVINEYKMETPKNVRVSKFYAGLRGGLSFLTWKNKYSGTETGSDSFSFKPLLGVDLSVGYRFNQKWRVDGELGYVGKYSETETEYYGDVEKTEFSLESYYLAANAYYDIIYGLYAGIGAGLAISDVAAYNSEVNDVSTVNVSPMGAVMFGWTYMLDEKIDFDIRYRFAVYGAGSLNIGGVDVDTGAIMNNSLSAGIRYHF